MHGRLKVRTTAEQQEAKQKEREKKKKLFNAAANKAFEKRKNGEFDKEALEVTGHMLTANPDFNTLWNYRREVLLHFKETLENDEFEKTMKGELQFSEYCLRTNPKSYGSWHQRCFVLDTMPNPDWKTELMLCNRYLELDERNFHCWDYRRYVVNKSKVSPKDEFAYTTEKISSNFSNFSSWHYRSKLIPLLYPCESHPQGIQEDVLLQEYEMVQNAFFTDPSDQSAWFYHRWLLGRGLRKLSLEKMCFSQKRRKIVVALSVSAKAGKDFLFNLIVNDLSETPSLISPSGSEFSKIWVCELEALGTAENINIEIKFNDSDQVHQYAITAEKEKVWTFNTNPHNLFSSELSAAASSTLTQELESIQQLYELEPDNKWVLLTIISLMRALDPLKYEKETLQYLNELMQIDISRKNYYHDLKCKYVIENRIMQLPRDCVELDLSGIGLASVPHTEKMLHIESLNLSENYLKEVPDLTALQFLNHLNLDNNELQNLEGLLQLPSQMVVSAKNNSLKITGVNKSNLESHLECLTLQE